MGSGPGLGPRNKATWSAGGKGVSKMRPKSSGNKKDWGTDEGKIYDSKNKIDPVKGHMGKDGEVNPIGEVRLPPQAGRSAMPKFSVTPSEHRAAEDALAKEPVPPAYREHVREYFDSLPKKK